TRHPRSTVFPYTTLFRSFDSETIQHVDPLPNRLVVVGAGYVGVEFAGMFARFGSQVTLVDRNAEWMRSEDRDVAQAVAEVLDDRSEEHTSELQSRENLVC